MSVSYRLPASLLASLAAVATLSSASGAMAQAAPSGETLFKQRCTVCHSNVAGQNKIGPSLAGVVGRKAGSAPGFTAYSTPIKASGLTWTAANLDKFLAKPAGLIPGTKMMIAVPDAAQRTALVSYLATQK